jgi:uncharacterized protein YbjT (DUF2867 family)
MDVLVAGATGQQGGAVADRLLSGDHGDFDVHALSRSPESDACQLLADRGATIVEGDLGDKDTLRPAVENVDAVFCVTQFFTAGHEGEVEHGTNLAEVAADVGVEHFVFSSVGGAERDTGIPHFDSKYEIEERIRDLGLPATIIRPVFFMQNFEGQREDITDGTLALPLAEDVSVQIVNVDDIGGLAAEALADPERYKGQAIELAGDEGTLEEMAQVFTEVTGVDIEAQHVPVDVAREQMGEEYAVMFEWFNEHGYEADIDALRREHDIDPSSLEEYLHEYGWAQRS